MSFVRHSWYVTNEIGSNVDKKSLNLLTISAVSFIILLLDIIDFTPCFSRWYLGCDRFVQLSSLYNVSLCLIDLIIPCVVYLFPLCLYLANFTCLCGKCLFFIYVKWSKYRRYCLDYNMAQYSWQLIYHFQAATERLFEISVSSLAINPLFDVSFFVHAYRYFVTGTDTKKNGWLSDILE